MADVLCVTSRWVDGHLWPGFTAREFFSPPTLLELGECGYQRRNDHPADPRPDVESNEDYRQVCTYVVLRSDERPFLRYLVYGRGAGGAEIRLRDRLSLGVGGHVEATDLNGGFAFEDLYSAAVREVREELVVSSSVKDVQFLGTVWSDDDEVSRKHIGLVFIADLSGELVSSRETETVVEPRFESLRDIRHKLFGKLERWSQIVAKELPETSFL